MNNVRPMFNMQVTCSRLVREVLFPHALVKCTLEAVLARSQRALRFDISHRLLFNEPSSFKWHCRVFRDGAQREQSCSLLY